MNDVHQPKLIIISAPSGAGKTTLCQRLLDEFPEKLAFSRSYTTRNPRGQEKDGIDYHFVSKNEFENLIKKNLLAEWAQVHDHYYGTSLELIQNAFSKGKSILLDIDVQGAASLAKRFPKQHLSVFIAPPSLDELFKRLHSRGTDSEEIIQKRIQNAQKEMEQAASFDFQITNDDLERAYIELRNLVVKEVIGSIQ